ncbi:MAG: hydrogenase nickel incorporation protein HypB [Phyllobacteriaceae bacterium]|nr:hydrogenase nickel incorporation protein HypB [Phyllobacteriaceae bacterium]
MCLDCGCGHDHGHSGHTHDHGDSATVAVFENLLAANDRTAERLRTLLDRHRVFAVNLMSSPGSGKTRLLEATFAALPPGLRVAVIEGDLETENDADRIRRHGVTAVQITTGVTCHLDATMTADAVARLDLDEIDVLFVENVGNLVCPADFDIGQHRDVVLLSVTEGDDKPDKYPVIFRGADLVLVTKTDLLPHFDEFDLARAHRSIDRVRGRAPIVDASAKTGEGMSAWVDWLVCEMRAHRAALDHRAATPAAPEPSHAGSP